MTFSMASLIVSLGMVLLLTIFLYVILWSKRTLKVIRIDFIILFFSLILFRLLLPIEFPTAITLKSTLILPTIFKWFRTTFFFGPLSFSLQDLLVWVWILGAVVRLVFTVKDYLSLSRKVNDLKYEPLPMENVESNLADAIKNMNVCVFLSEASPSVVTVGIVKPRIIIPKIPSLTRTEINYILAHEIQHIRNKDIFLKCLLELVVSLYWWFPPIYLLRANLELILEMRVDTQVSQSLDTDNYFGYTESLVSVGKKMVTDSSVKSKFPSSKVVNFVPTSSSLLEKRIDFLLEGFEVRKTNRFVLMTLFVIPFFFLGIIFEPYAESYEKLEKTFLLEDISDSYILKTKEGRYYYYGDGENLGEIYDTNGPIAKDLPIIEE